ncbi:hypothetical protein DSECCO2_314980 [anaerobic digester metagenome]
MRVILSIRPKHIRKIINGTKRYEFRKVMFKDRSVCEIYVYSTSPVKRIIGRFKVGKIFEDRPENLWEQLREYSGLTQKDFYAYFSEKDKGYAIEIINFELFEEPIDPKKLNPTFVAPQSFQYIDDSTFNHQLDPNKSGLGKFIQIEV